jgi:septum formation protein
LKHANSAASSHESSSRKTGAGVEQSTARGNTRARWLAATKSSVAGIDETVLPNEEPAAYVQRLARSKAEAVASRVGEGLVLGADTTVVVANQILGQPVDDADARRMLRLLNAKWHDVLTGVAVVRVSGETRVAYETTRVRFAEMSEKEIDWYIATREPFGKAGAYGIQGKASLFIEEIEGDYFNIMGLPIRLVYELTGSN